MRLSEFILQNIEPILSQWESFARTLPRGSAMSIAALRNDAERMLRFIATDMESAQTRDEQTAKSKGHGPALPLGQHSAAHDHGLQRAQEGFTLTDMVSEYRALRASVMSLWTDALASLGGSMPLREASSELTRFHEAMDQILAESVNRFSAKLEYDRDLFLGVLGHDLRNPLQAIAMSAQVLVRAQRLSATEQKEMGVRLGASSLRAQRLVEDLTEFARGRLGATPALSVRACDMREIMRDAIDELRRAHPERAFDYGTFGDCSGQWDAARVHQMAANLIANAAQYGRTGTPVVVSVQGDPGEVQLVVRSASDPIPMEHRAAMFDPLRRGRSLEPESERRHLGLGLYIARTIARQHGGDVELTSSDENGTVFTARLPRSGAT
jgi:signal transduction histidine kinase